MHCIRVTCDAEAVKHITSSAEERLIEAAHERAHAEHTTLNEQFRRWLADYAQAQPRVQRCDDEMAQLRGRLQVGRKLSREEANAR